MRGAARSNCHSLKIWVWVWVWALVPAHQRGPGMFWIFRISEVTVGSQQTPKTSPHTVL